jgi:hypothetical protein
MEERKVLNTVERRQANWNRYGLRGTCILKHVIEGKIQVKLDWTGKPGRRREQLLDDLRETSKCRKLKREALGRAVLRTGCGRGQ